MKTIPTFTRLVCAVVFAVTLSRAAARADDKPAEQLVRANYRSVNDSMGFRWDVNSYGMINDGSDDCFDGALRLDVNGSQFYCSNNAMMTSDGKEYVLSRKMSGMNVTRRIRIDTERSFVRYLEIFENTKNSAATVRVDLRTSLGNTYQQVVTNTGSVFSGIFGKKDCGILAMVNSGSRPSVMHVLRHPKGKVQPAVTMSDQRNFIFTFNLSLKAGEKAAVMHLVAQRRGVSASTAPDAFKKLYARNRLVRIDVPKDLKKLVLNFRSWGGAEGPGKLLQPLLRLAEHAGMDRGMEDQLVVEDDTVVAGTVSCGAFEVETPYGTRKVDPGDIVLLFGGKSTARPHRVFLRDGQVLAGTVKAQDFVLKTREEFTVELDPEALDMLFMRADLRDGHPAAGVTGFVDTHRGDRLAIVQKDDLTVDTITPWGSAKIPLSDMDYLYYSREDQPGHRVVLKNGSRFPVILKNPELTVDTLLFGSLKLTGLLVSGLRSVETDSVMPSDAVLPDDASKALEKVVSADLQNVTVKAMLEWLDESAGLSVKVEPEIEEEVAEHRVTLRAADAPAGAILKWLLKSTGLKLAWQDKAFVAVSAAGDEAATGDDGEIRATHMLLAGENMLVGTISAPQLHVLSDGAVTPVESGHISSFERSDEEGEALPIFSMTLAGGGTMTGRLKERMIPVEWKDTRWRIPVWQIISFERYEPEEVAGEGEGVPKEKKKEEKKADGASLIKNLLKRLQQAAP